MKRKLIALGLVFILILTNIVSFDFLGLMAKATSNEIVEEENKYKDIKFLAILGSKDYNNLKFYNDTMTMGERILDAIEKAYLDFTRSNLFDGSADNDLLCPYVIKNDKKILKEIKDIDNLKKNGTLTVVFSNSGSEKTYTFDLGTLAGDNDLEKLKKTLKSLVLGMHWASFLGLVDQSLLSLKSGFDSPNRLSDIMEMKEGESVYSFKKNVKLDLFPDGLYHPLLGKLRGNDISKFFDNCYDSKYVQKLNIIEKEGRLYYEVSPEYAPLLEEESRKEYLEGYDVVDESVVKNSIGFLPCTKTIREFKDTYECKPKYCVSYLYELAIPDNYVKSSGNKNLYVMEYYHLGYQKYLCLNGIVIDVKTNNVYGYNENAEYGHLGSFADFGIDRKYVYLHTSLSSNVSLNDIKTLVDEDKVQNKTSVAVYTKLYEAIWDTSVASDITAEELKNKVITRINEKGGLYLTGRQVLFDMYYASKMPFETVINNTIQLTEGGIEKSTYAKYFAFGPYENGEVNATKKECHYRTTADSFRFQAAFVNIKDANGATEFSGICLIRNNYYATEPSLISWLSSAVASGLPYVNAEELMNLLVANSTANDDKLTYEQFGKLEVIKEKLAHLHDNEVYSIVRIVIIIAGFIFVFYGALLLIAFWFDVLNPTNEINLLSKISFGRLRACIPDDYAYLSASTEYKYITWKQMLVRVLACFFVGLILINYEFVLSGIIYIYMTIKEIAGLE